MEPSGHPNIVDTIIYLVGRQVSWELEITGLNPEVKSIMKKVLVIVLEVLV